MSSPNSIPDGELETAGQMAAALREGHVSSLELTERALGRAHAWQRATNAFSQTWDEEAVQAARGVDRTSPTDRGPWAGIPVAVKDLYDVAGHETTGCCRAYAGNRAPSDAPIVADVRAAGMVMIGKTNQHELAAGGTNLVSACGRTGNPWDASRMTGGSSGGSGAAVAAGVVPWALGSDTGGSIRIPASLCGTFGLKPTTGRLPTTGLMPLAPSLDCPGPMAGTVGDLRALYGVIAGAAPASDGTTPPTADPSRHRLALPGGIFAERIHDEVAAAVLGVGETFQAAGLSVDQVDGGGIEDARLIWMRVCCPEFALAYPDLSGDRLDLVHPSVRAWLEIGVSLTAEDRDHAARRRREIAEWFRRSLDGREAMVIPTTPYPAPPAEASEVDLGSAGTVRLDELGPGWLTSSVNLSGLPAVSLPAARSSDGLPIGVTLVGNQDAEETLFDLAELWERESGHRLEHPPLPRS